MKRRKKKGHYKLLKVYSYDEALKMVPLLKSIVTSIREHWIEWQQNRRQLEKLEKNSTLSKREKILQHGMLSEGEHRLETEFFDSLAELNKFDVYLYDPVQGSAMIPIRQNDELAWIVLEAYSDAGLSGWRFHKDPLEERRSLEEVRVAAAVPGS